MREAGVLIDLKTNEPLYWHAPAGRSCAYLPDSRDLWEVIWEHRGKILGFAHSHPGSGVPVPSHEDLTTFRAIEAALGTSLAWWITSSDVFAMIVPVDYRSWSYVTVPYRIFPKWLDELRRISHTEE